MTAMSTPSTCARCPHHGRPLGSWSQIDVFPSAERFLTRYERRRDVDILLLDVEMGSMDGVALAKAVRKAGGTMQIVFVTGYSDYIDEGYDVEALNYLMKPVDAAKLFDVLDKAVVRMRRDSRCLDLQCAEGLMRIPLADIRYLDVRRNYVTVHVDRDYTVNARWASSRPSSATDSAGWDVR